MADEKGRERIPLGVHAPARILPRRVQLAEVEHLVEVAELAEAAAGVWVPPDAQRVENGLAHHVGRHRVGGVTERVTHPPILGAEL